MTEIERKALALVNEVQAERNHTGSPWNSPTILSEALDRAIEQHEAYKQEVSDAVEVHKIWLPTEVAKRSTLLDRFILPKPVDTLAECLLELNLSKDDQEARHDAKWLAQTIEKRGGKIVWGEGA